MPRLRHVVSGVVVSVGDDVAARLGSDWAPVKESSTRSRKSKSEQE